MKRSTMTKLIEMQIKSDGLIQRSPVESTHRFAERILQAVLKAGMVAPLIGAGTHDCWGNENEVNDFEPE
jgi:hypothetical protein